MAFAMRKTPVIRGKNARQFLNRAEMNEKVLEKRLPSYYEQKPIEIGVSLSNNGRSFKRSR